MAEKSKAIRFKVSWQGHPKGSVNATLGLGVMKTLVENNKAMWAEAESARRRGRPKSEQPQE